MQPTYKSILSIAPLFLLAMPQALYAQVCQGGTVPVACLPDVSANEIVAVSEIETGYYPNIITYSATELGTNVSPWYDAQVSAALYQGNTVVQSWAYVGSVLAECSMATPWLANQQYLVVTYHYILPFYYYSGWGYYSPYVFGTSGQTALWTFFATPNPNPWIATSYVSLGLTASWLDTYLPVISSITPASDANTLPNNMGTAIPQNSYACVYINGSYLTAGGADLTPMAIDATPNPSGTLVPFVWPGANATNTDSQLEVCYTSPSNATMGMHYLQVTTDAGSSALYEGGPGSGDGLYCEHPTPTNLCLSPSNWQVGSGASTTVNFSIFGCSGPVFGDNGGFVNGVAGPGVQGYSSNGFSGQTLLASVTIGASSPGGNASVTVDIEGGEGSDGVQVQPGSMTLTAQISPAIPPAPTIVLGQQATTPDVCSGTNIAGTTQNFIVGQRIAFTTCLGNYEIYSESWTPPPTFTRSAVSSFTVTQGANYSNSGSGKALAATNPTCGTASSCDFPPFYWVDGSNTQSQQFTFLYHLTDGLSATATVTFNFDAPSGVIVSVTNYKTQVYSPNPTSAIVNPFLILGGGPQDPQGMTFFASASHLPAGGQSPATAQWLWTQLVNSEAQQYSLTNSATTNTLQETGVPGLDNWYPYGFKPGGLAFGTVTSNGGPNNQATDSPSTELVPENPAWGEYSRTFQATMYLMWVPNPDTTCSSTPSVPAGSPIQGTNPPTYAPGTETNPPPCVIPVPQGTIPWNWSGDATNSLQTTTSYNSSGQQVPYVQWYLVCGFPSPQNPGSFQFQPNSSLASANTWFPTWTAVRLNQ